MQQPVVRQLATVNPAGFLRRAIHEAMADAKAAVAQSSSLCESQPVAFRKVFEEGTILQTVISLALEAV